MSNEKIEIIVSTKFLPERSDPTKSLFFFSYWFYMRNSTVVEDCSREPWVLSSNHTKTLAFHLEIWFFENFHRGPYFVGFQTKWIMTP